MMNEAFHGNAPPAHEQAKDQAAQWADGVKNKRDPLAAVLAKGFLKRKDDGR
jgi:hypothetical protein